MIPTRQQCIRLLGDAVELHVVVAEVLRQAPNIVLAALPEAVAVRLLEALVHVEAGLRRVRALRGCQEPSHFAHCRPHRGVSPP